MTNPSAPSTIEMRRPGLPAADLGNGNNCREALPVNRRDKGAESIGIPGLRPVQMQTSQTGLHCSHLLLPAFLRLLEQARRKAEDKRDGAIGRPECRSNLAEAVELINSCEDLAVAVESVPVQQFQPIGECRRPPRYDHCPVVLSEASVPRRLE